MSLLVSFGSAVTSLHVMRVKANRRLSEIERISYFLPMTKWSRVTDAYRRLYPQGRAYFVWKISVIGTIVFAVGIVLGQIWELAAAK